MDVGLLRPGDVSFGLIRPVEFASDRLVWDYIPTYRYHRIWANKRRRRMTLLEINNLNVPPVHPAQYLWYSMSWLTSITKRNMTHHTSKQIQTQPCPRCLDCFVDFSLYNLD
eukprot:scaffold3521_cov195-Alexandrium_tamarense.AAC.25